MKNNTLPTRAEVGVLLRVKSRSVATIQLRASDIVELCDLEDIELLGFVNSSKENAAIRGNYLRFFGQYLEVLNIPDGTTKDKDAVASLAKKTHSLHSDRRTLTVTFLKAMDVDTPSSSIRNPLEQPWSLEEQEFLKRTKNGSVAAFKNTKEETLALTEEIQKVEQEIDERVAALYGL